MKIKYFIKIKVQNSRFSTSRADPFIRVGGSVHGPKQPNCLRLVDLFVSEPPGLTTKKSNKSLSDIIWLVEEHFEAQGRI